MSAKKRKQAKNRVAIESHDRKVFRHSVSEANSTAKGETRWRYVTLGVDKEIDFNDEQKKRVSTQVGVAIPYSLSGLHTSPLTVYDDDGNKCFVELTHVRYPLNFVMHVLGSKVKGDVRTLDMDGDSWGRVAYTRAYVTLPFYCKIVPEFKNTEDEVPPVDLVSRKLLEHICVVLNRVIGAYVLHTSRYDLRELAPSDFLHYSAKHLFDGELYNYTLVFYLSFHT